MLGEILITDHYQLSHSNVSRLYCTVDLEITVFYQYQYVLEYHCAVFLFSNQWSNCDSMLQAHPPVVTVLLHARFHLK